MTTFRLFIGGLSDEVQEHEIQNKLRPFGKVQDIDVHTKRDSEGHVMKTFAYANITGDYSKFRKCLSTLNGMEWNGQLLQVQVAKEKFTDRLKKEQAEESRSPGRKVTADRKLSDRNTISTKLVPRQKQLDNCQWVKNEQGNLEPVLNIRQPDRKMVIKHDPSVGKNKVRKLECENSNSTLVDNSTVTELTWSIDEEPLHKHKQKNRPRYESPIAKNSQYNSDNLTVKNSNVSARNTYTGKPQNQGIVEFSDSDDCEYFNTSMNKGKMGAMATSKDYSSGEETDDMIDRLRTNKISGRTPPKSGQITSQTKGKLQDVEHSLSVLKPSEERPVSQYTSSSASEEEMDTRHIDKKSMKGVPENGEGNKKQVLQKLDNSDSESDVPDIEGWVKNRKTTTGTPRLDDGASVPSESTHAPTSHGKKVVKVDQSKNTVITDLLNKNSKKDRETKKCVKNEESKAKAKSTDNPINPPLSGKIQSNSVYDSDDSLSESRLTARHSKFAKMPKQLNKHSSIVSQNQVIEEYSSGFGDSETKMHGCSSSEDEDLLDCIAAGKIHKLKEIQKKNQQKHQKICAKKKGRRSIDTDKDNIAADCAKDISKCDVGGTSGAEVVDDSQDDLASKSKSGISLSVHNSSEDSHLNEKKELKKKHEISNTQRLESLKARQRQTALQRSAVQKALANVDSVEKNRKIVFDSDSSEEEAPCTQNKPDQNDSKVEEKPRLFAESEDSGADIESDTERFSLKPQFEGKLGQKLMKLQTKFKGDERFKFDSRFVESESDSEQETMKEADELEVKEGEEVTEREQNLKLLESVVGKKLSMKKSKKGFKELTGVHYDPSRADHAQFEVKKSPEPRPKKQKVKPEMPSIGEAPEVSKEKFYEVCTSLKDIFHKPATEGEDGDQTLSESKQEKEEKPFSLLEMFGSHEEEKPDDTDAMPRVSAVLPVKTFPWQQEFDSSEDEENVQEKSAEKKEKTGGGSIKTNQQTFFFMTGDPRLKEGLEFFCRQEPLETLREAWQQKRPGLIEAYRMRRKRSLRKRRSTQVFQARLKKRRKFNNQKK